jgi:hypothetical protein
MVIGKSSQKVDEVKILRRREGDKEEEEVLVDKTQEHVKHFFKEM